MLITWIVVTVIQIYTDVQIHSFAYVNYNNI